MKTFAMFLFTMLLIGCQTQKPPCQHPESLEEFQETFTKLYMGGENDDIFKLIHGFQGSVHQGFLKMVFKTGADVSEIGYINILPKDADAPLGFRKEIKTMKNVKQNFAHSHLLYMKCSNDSEEQITIVWGVGEINGKWFLPGIQPSIEPEPIVKEYPAGMQVYGDKEITITKAGGIDRGIDLQFSKDYTMVVKFKAERVSLRDLMLVLDIRGRWYKGLDLLPESGFTIKVHKQSMPPEELKNLVYRALEKAFELKITLVEFPWDGFTLVFPDKIQPPFRKVEKAGWTNGTSHEGHFFKDCDVSDFREWFLGVFKRPVDIIVDKDFGRFDLDLKYDDFDLYKVLEMLDKKGIRVTPGKLVRQTFIIEKKI